MKNIQKITVAILLLFGYASFAQNNSSEPHVSGPFAIPLIDTWDIYSSTIGENYKVYVLRTAAYDAGTVKLPVLYMTDGDWNMTVAMNCFSMLRQDYKTQEPLVVGIGYGKGENKRFRDLDPEKGGPKFLEFIEKEVIPFINQQYRTTNEKAIYGYSLGGVFTTYILFNRPELFEKVFIGAPANGGRFLLPEAKHYFESHKDLKNKVFVGVGGYERETTRNINLFKDFLISQKCPSLELQSTIAPNAGHGAGLAQVMQDAIMFGYCDQPKEVKVSTKILESYKGTYVWDQGPNVLLFIKDDKLFCQFESTDGAEMQLVPKSESEFFLLENQLVQCAFKKENDKYKLFVDMGNGQKATLTKKE